MKESAHLYIICALWFWILYMYTQQDRELQLRASFQTQDKLISQELVKPTNALYYLLFKPMPCEVKAAKMSNEALANRQENNIAAVAFNYLDNKKYQKSIVFELVNYSISSFFILFLESCKIENSPLSLLRLIFLVVPLANTASVKLLQRVRVSEASFLERLAFSFLLATALFLVPKEKYSTMTMLAFIFCHILPNLFNLKRHTKTKEACEAWLSAKLSESSMNELHALTHFIDGYSVKSMNKLQSVLEREQIDPSPIWDAVYRA